MCGSFNICRRYQMFVRMGKHCPFRKIRMFLLVVSAVALVVILAGVGRYYAFTLNRDIEISNHERDHWHKEAKDLLEERFAITRTDIQEGTQFIEVEFKKGVK